MAPPTNCLSPIGEPALLAGLYRQIKGEFYTAVTRPPAVYRGNPFVIEAGLALWRAPAGGAQTPAQKAIPLPQREAEKDAHQRARALPEAHPLPRPYHA